ncbi:hypothetical protein Rsub_10588 [Raphidocelis subcapitata]|uniref:Uncharacterized protein n=1 Tax=Raphidocelis subcapitata TaxID=307507 RepID=A0A2V0PLL1_9CHLO|nr:hypothetical protein Rsub_10588 [Raphidocelis subcapitata]|eukprot:GBF97915.1 hypothetical protein Rsub_10588 [Raphidocelis subcapitata]
MDSTCRSAQLLSPAAPRCGAALAAAAAALLLALCLAPLAAADATAFATTLAMKTTDPAACGLLGQPCCLARGRSGGLRCGAGGLACVPLTGAQALRCHACGGEDQPACDGGKCDQGLSPIAGAGVVPICIAATRPLPPRSTSSNPAERARLDNAFGQRVMGACAAAADCAGNRVCAGGICVPCGGPRQACCRAPAAPCRQYGPGPGALACAADARLGISTCASPAS